MIMLNPTISYHREQLYCADGDVLVGQVRGHVDAGCDGQLRVELPIGDDSSVTDIHKMCTTDSSSCTQPRDACTHVVLLEHGHYDDEPASKLLLVPHTGTSCHCYCCCYCYCYCCCEHTVHLELSTTQHLWVSVITSDRCATCSQHCPCPCSPTLTLPHSCVVFCWCIRFISHFITALHAYSLAWPQAKHASIFELVPEPGNRKVAAWTASGVKVPWVASLSFVWLLQAF